ncbi:MAG: branched-chain amino acid ABC transporter permease [Nitriliruptorales bacterium]|nr:branched-chain amino acid ABC transporter permease [Nitriliruptorales bacterium]
MTGGRTAGSARRGRPELYTSYEADSALLNTRPKRVAVLLIVALAVIVPFLLTDNVLLILATAFVASIGAIGLNLVTGYAGQVSLGHAFFLGLGAFTGAVLSGDPDGRTVGLGMQLLVWLPAAGLVAAAAGLLVAPFAVRLRGLYLAIVTLGLVFLGEHLFREMQFITGGVGVGRPGPVPELFGFRFDQAGEVLGVMLTRNQKMYYLMFVLLLIMAVAGRNIARSAIGRAFAAVRDRDIAAEVIGVPLTKYKALAFTISSFYAGIAGALLYTVIGVIEPGSFNLLMSVQYIAMVLIGGVATISGSIMGAVFITLLPRITREVPKFLPFISGGATGGGILNVFQLEAILYGLLIIGFLIFEPRGLYGIWIRTRNYWKGWPFSY